MKYFTTQFRNAVSFLLLLLFSMGANHALIAQSPAQLEKIKKETNVAKLQELSIKWGLKHKEDMEKALAMAKEKGWVVRKELPSGILIQLVGVTETGQPIYYETDASSAAATISTNKVHPGGGLGLALDGSGMKMAQWDGGGIALTHPEITGRAVIRDDATGINFHANHVAGILISEGVNPDAKGMAFRANLDAYSFDDDNEEMPIAAADGLLISNHSYGFGFGWESGAWGGISAISTVEDYRFGFYSDAEVAWDEIAYNAPYYLIVKSAGNERGESGAGSAEVDGGVDGFDCLSGPGGAKNILTIGAVNDIPNGYNSPSDVVVASFSGFGPTDDGRIKPDLVGNGVNVFSLGSGSNDYTRRSGTSMAAPNVSGSLLLLQEHYSELHDGDFMRAATLKGLAIHTTDEAGANEGPDYSHGWGLVNIARAAQVISNDGDDAAILEESLLEGDTYTLVIGSDGTGPLDLTISWTDKEGTPIAPALNQRDLMLVNDLDLRISNGTQTFEPYVLDPENPAAAATRGDNFRDNVERIHIENPTAGIYTITITHKGTLFSGKQDFSLIISGQEICPSAALNLENSYIQSVNFGGIATSDASCATYTDYSDQVASIFAGETIQMDVNLASCDADNNRIVKVFIDWDHSNNFDESTETTAVSGVVNSGTVSFDITAPTIDFLKGKNIAVRVVAMETDNPDDVTACGSYDFGETEDYSLYLAVTLPEITTLPSETFLRGEKITFTGTLLDEVSQVKIGDVNARFTIDNPTTITAYIPYMATDGRVILGNQFGESESATSLNIVDGYAMSTDSLWVCDDYYYDPSGLKDHSGGIRWVQIVSPATSGNTLLATIDELELLSGDKLQIYDGRASGFSLLTTLTDASSVGESFLIRNSAGFLTMRFTSTNNTDARNWKIHFECLGFTSVPVVTSFEKTFEEDIAGAFDADVFNEHVRSFADVQGTIIETLPAEGTLTYDGNTLDAGDKITDWGLLNYTPVANWHGTTSFDIKVENEHGASEVATITLNVSAVNDVPEIGDVGPFDVCANTEVTVNVEDHITDNDDLLLNPFDDYVIEFLIDASSDLQASDLTIAYDDLTHIATLVSESADLGDYQVVMKVTDGSHIVEKTFTMTSKPAAKLTVTQVDLVLTASTAGNYQWYRNGIAIQNETSSILLANLLGEYYVETTYSNGCVVRSETFVIDRATALSFDDISQDISVFPNPTTDKVTVTIDNQLTGAFEISILSLDGKLQRTFKVIKPTSSLEQELDLGKLPNGVYLLKIKHENHGAVQRLMKY